MMESDFTSPELDDDLLSAGEEAIFSMSISETNKCRLGLFQFQQNLIMIKRGLCFAGFQMMDNGYSARSCVNACVNG